MLGAFAMAVREGRFLRDCHKVLVEGTVRGAVSHVVQTFRASGRQNPTKDDDRELSILLSRQYQTYKNKDPQQKQQKALQFIVLDELAKHQVTELDIALGQLTIGAAFFARRSYKYSAVPKREERRTNVCKILDSLRTGILFRRLLLIRNQTAKPSLLKCKRMTASLIQSFTVGWTIQFSALVSYNGPNW